MYPHISRLNSSINFEYSSLSTYTLALFIGHWERLKHLYIIQNSLDIKDATFWSHMLHEILEIPSCSLDLLTEKLKIPKFILEKIQNQICITPFLDSNQIETFLHFHAEVRPDLQTFSFKKQD